MIVRKNTIEIILILVVFCLGSCISPIDTNVAQNTSYLVVDGSITNRFGPHEIKLSRSVPYDSLGLNEELNAKLLLKDDLGNQISLKPHNEFFYATPDSFKGEIGRSYTLHIELADGSQYQSITQKMEPTLNIEQLQVEHFVEREVYSEYGVFYSELGTRFSLQCGKSIFSKYFQIKWSLKGLHPKEVAFWDDLEEGNKYINLLNYDQKTVGELNDFEVAFLPWPTTTRVYLKNIWDAVLEQTRDTTKADSTMNAFKWESFELSAEIYSINREVFGQLEQLKMQNEVNGAILVTAPAQIRGNIYSQNDEYELVLGFFGVSAVSEKTVKIRRNKIY